MAQFENAKLVIVGRGDLQPLLEQLYRFLGLNDKVRIINDATDDDLPGLYNMARVTVLPSINQAEAFGLVLIESMACGSAVIASDLPGVRTVVEDGVNGFLVPPKDIEGLSDKIITLLQNDELSHRFGENGRKKVQQQYLWQQSFSV